MAFPDASRAHEPKERLGLDGKRLIDLIRYDNIILPDSLYRIDDCAVDHCQVGYVGRVTKPIGQIAFYNVGLWNSCYH
jgi:hypothetical protein